MGITSGLLFEIPDFLRKMLDINDPWAVDDQNGLNGIFQFPDISRPFVIGQEIHGLLRDSLYLHMIFLIIFLNKKMDEKGNIIPPIPQGRKFDIHHIQTIIEILSKYLLSSPPPGDPGCLQQ